MYTKGHTISWNADKRGHQEAALSSYRCAKGVHALVVVDLVASCGNADTVHQVI